MGDKNRILAKGTVHHIRMAGLIISMMLTGLVVRSQTATPTIDKLFQNSYKVFDAMRIKTAPGVGIYLDALAINAGAKPVALAANGVGLISLCIADAMYKKTGDAVNWDAHAEVKALQTINEWIRLKETPGAVNVNGLFHRYLDPKDGSWVWVTEHSTIDNAIMAMGFLFCKNYFNTNAEIVSKANILLNSMDFTAAISGGNMYMILDDNGAPSVVANPFNEYLVLAWVAKNSNPSFPGYAGAQTYWNTYFSDPTKLPKYNYPTGNPILSGGNYAQPSFHIQFSYYYCNYFNKNADYTSYFRNQFTAEKAWWQNITGQQTAWGCGAGEVPGGGAYSADAINYNPNRIVSPHIMAGFSPVFPEVRDDLAALYANGTGPAVYKIPGTNREFLWRYKFNNPGDRTPYVQAVDFSTMLYGLAELPEYLGTNFFKTYNDFNFNPTSSSFDLKKDNSHLLIYPNPSTGQTTLQFAFQNKGMVKIEIYSEDGQMVRQLAGKEMAAGKYSVNWDGKNESNSVVSPGTYLCRLSIDGQAYQTKKVMIIK